ncbi:AsmA-like C-terminal region-containing protein [Terracidiphilus sp.]|uniref:AsmA-like C-terminal region-containing protein n=1 Tax=Terracidiphilus sp. TaxID=1964191 RepID=UPI003C745F58
MASPSPTAPQPTAFAEPPPWPCRFHAPPASSAHRISPSASPRSTSPRCSRHCSAHTNREPSSPRSSIASAPPHNLQVESHGIKFTSLDARIFGGQIRGTASLAIPATQPAMPIYTLDASFTGINPTPLSKVLGEKWAGGPISGSGTLKLSGFTPADLASSALGALNFDWRNGRITRQPDQAADSSSQTEFTRWTGTAKIDKSAITLGENKLQQSGGKPTKAEGSLTFAQQPKLTLITAPTNPQP